MLSDKVLMTSITDRGVEISPLTYWINLISQLINGSSISCILIGNHLFFYVISIVIIFRMRTITTILKDHRIAKETPELSLAQRKWIILECHLMQVELSR